MGSSGVYADGPILGTKGGAVAEKHDAIFLQMKRSSQMTLKENRNLKQGDDLAAKIFFRRRRFQI